VSSCGRVKSHGLAAYQMRLTRHDGTGSDPTARKRARTGWARRSQDGGVAPCAVVTRHTDRGGSQRHRVRLVRRRQDVAVVTVAVRDCQARLHRCVRRRGDRKG
jgi:hypothetical protein